jgi:hypothetical protein
MNAIHTNPAPNLTVLKAPEVKASKEHFIHPFVDVMMMGGLSILFYLGMHFFVEPSNNINRISWTMFYLSFAVNYPHFMASYVILYKENSHKILKDWKFIWAGIVAPVCLLGGMFFLTQMSLTKNNNEFLSFLPNLMYFLVGHHYVKQIYGCVLVCSAKKKFYLSELEKNVLRGAMFSIWGLSFISSNIYQGSNSFYGVGYSTFNLNPVWQTVAYASVGIFTALLGALFVKRYVKDGKVLPLTAWAALLSIYVWYLPTLGHAHYFYMIPFFHSLQYLLFTNTFAKNKASSEAKIHKEESQKRLSFLKSFTFFTALTIVTGFLAWEYVPKLLDTNYPLNPFLGATMWMFYFQFFLNVHHYLIDGVIWRRDSDAVVKHL